MSDQPIEYLEARVVDALAHDGRVAELGLQVRAHGGRLVVTGAVSTPARREAVTAVVAEVAPGYEVRNDTVVAGIGEPSGEESLA